MVSEIKSRKEIKKKNETISLLNFLFFSFIYFPGVDSWEISGSKTAFDTTLSANF